MNIVHDHDAARAKEIASMLDDEAPRLNWMVEPWSELEAYKVTANIRIDGEYTVAAVCVLPYVYLSGNWLAYVKYTVAHLIALELLKEGGN